MDWTTWSFAGVLCTLGLYAAPTATAQTAAGATENGELSEVHFDDLMKLPVTSVSKREQLLGDAAAAIAVLSNDDLRRSGATSVADALRLVPGLDVGSASASEWAISARGFNSAFAQKLLVLVDGRAVYTPLFSGVYWDLQQTPLEDVDRIEVIRGPGATVWGANAVNGVINIVTRSARDSQGGRLSVGAGDVDEVVGSARYGGRVGADTFYRAFVGYRSVDDFPGPTGEPNGDHWNDWHGGFRLDRYPDDDRQLTWQGDYTQVSLGGRDSEAYNANTLGRYTRKLSSRSSFELQAYYDRSHRDEANTIVGVVNTIDTVDITAQQTLGLGERNNLIWGAGNRYVANRLDVSGSLLPLDDDEVNSSVVSAFVQGEFSVVPDKLLLTAGVKVEHNDFTGVEVQPSARAVFKPAQNQTLWGAVSRAVRTPSAIEARNIFSIPIGGPVPGPGGGLYIPSFAGTGDPDSEVLWAYEIGYRVQPGAQLSVDLSAFHNEYDELIGYGPAVRYIPGFPVGVAEVPFLNLMEAEADGGEASVTWSPVDHWRLIASYTLLSLDIDGPPGALLTQRRGADPEHQATLRSAYDFSSDLSLNAQLRYVDGILGVPAYTTADVNVLYRLSERLELSLVGRNLLEHRHPEQGPTPPLLTSEAPRSVFGRIGWSF